jgi:hypothetical protein
MREALTAGGPISRIAVVDSPERRTLALMLSSERLTETASKPILRAITAIHSRVRIAVFPACSIKAPNQSSTSTALPRAAEVALFSRSDDEVTRGPERDVPTAICQPATLIATLMP